VTITAVRIVDPSGVPVRANRRILYRTMTVTPPSDLPPAAPPQASPGRLGRLDRDVSRWFAVTWPRPRWVTVPLAALSRTANYGALWYAIALMPLVLGEPRPLARALFVAVPVTLVEASGFLIKLKVARPRPPLADPDQTRQIPLPFSKSFPSSHASMSVVGTLTVAAMYPWALPILVALTVVLCFSRVYLGVHYLGDVLGGIGYGLLFGAAWVLLVTAPA
jgi:undecaprenyl-diphosphatase